MIVGARQPADFVVSVPSRPSSAPANMFVYPGHRTPNGAAASEPLQTGRSHHVVKELSLVYTHTTVVPPVVQLSLVVQFADHGLSSFPTWPKIF
jgi:hypothetical protein